MGPFASKAVPEERRFLHRRFGRVLAVFVKIEVFARSFGCGFDLGFEKWRLRPPSPRNNVRSCEEFLHFVPVLSFSLCFRIGLIHHLVIDSHLRPHYSVSLTLSFIFQILIKTTKFLVFSLCSNIQLWCFIVQIIYFSIFFFSDLYSIVFNYSYKFNNRRNTS